MSQWDQNGGVFYFDAKSAKTGKKAYFDQQTSCTLPLGRSKFATNLFVFDDVNIFFHLCLSIILKISLPLNCIGKHKKAQQCL